MSQYSLGHDLHEQKRLQRQAGFLRDITERIWREAGTAPGMHVLDVGCGVGDSSFLAAELVGSEGSVVGQDRSAQAVEAATKRAQAAAMQNVRFVQGELGAPVSGHGPFDAVVGRLVLIHQPDVAAALRSLRGLLKPGGIVAFHEIQLGVISICEPSSALVAQVRALITEAFRDAGGEIALVVRRWFRQSGAGQWWSVGGGLKGTGASVVDRDGGAHNLEWGRRGRAWAGSVG